MKKISTVWTGAVLAALAISASAAMFGNSKKEDSAKSEWKTVVNADKRDAIKKLAFASIFGPSQGAVSTNKEFTTFAQQDALDYLEDTLRTKFAASGMAPLSGDKTKGAFDTFNLTSAVSQVYGKPKPTPEQAAMFKKQMEQIQKFRAAVPKPKVTMDRSGHLQYVPLGSSAHTDVMEDHLTFEKTQYLNELSQMPPAYHEKLLKALGLISKDLEADGFLVAKFETRFDIAKSEQGVKLIVRSDIRPVTHTELHVAVYNNAGELAFNDVVKVEGKEHLGEFTGGGTSYSYKEGDVQKLVKASIDEAVAQAFEHFKGGETAKK